MLQEHEKFWAFILLGAGIVGIAVLVIFHPLPDGTGSQRVVDTISGGLLLAFGACANALFRISNSTEQQAIADKTAQSIADRGPVPVTGPEGGPVAVSETPPAPSEPQNS